MQRSHPAKKSIILLNLLGILANFYANQSNSNQKLLLVAGANTARSAHPCSRNKHYRNNTECGQWWFAGGLGRNSVRKIGRAGDWRELRQPITRLLQETGRSLVPASDTHRTGDHRGPDDRHRPTRSGSAISAILRRAGNHPVPAICRSA